MSQHTSNPALAAAPPRGPRPAPGAVPPHPLKLRAVQGLMLASFLTTLGRAVTLPFIAIYLGRQFGLGPGPVGALLTASLVAASLAGVYGGWLVDRCRRVPLLLAGVAGAALATALVPWLAGPVLALVALTLASGALSVIDVGIKASCAALLDEGGRAKAYSVRYVINNIAYAAGPVLGTVLLARGEALLFAASGLLCGLALLPLLAHGADLARARPSAVGAPAGFRAALGVLRRDRALIAFTLGGMLLALVYGRFSAYLAQYLSSVTSTAQAYATVGQAITVNALGVVALQYLVGSRLSHDRLLRWQAGGSALLALGLAGFMLSTESLPWMVAMAVFTLGEIVVVPAAYLFIDHIAPDAMKGVYYGVQNLAALGSAASPLLCGLLLQAGWGAAMFVVLMACTALSWLCYLAGVGQRREAFSTKELPQ